MVVDDEPDVEALILQRFRQKIKDGAIDFLFARGGVEALTALKANSGIDLVVTETNMPRMLGMYRVVGIFAHEAPVRQLVDRVERINPE